MMPALIFVLALIFLVSFRIVRSLAPPSFRRAQVGFRIDPGFCGRSPVLSYALLGSKPAFTFVLVRIALSSFLKAPRMPSFLRARIEYGIDHPAIFCFCKYL